MEYASSRQEIAAEVVTHFTADAEEQRRYQKALARNISKPSTGLLNQLPAASSVRKWSFGRQMQTLLSLHIFYKRKQRRFCNKADNCDEKRHFRQWYLWTLTKAASTTKVNLDARHMYF